MDRIRQAVILAGGRGERLRPFTDNMPKPMFPIHNRPFLEYLIDLLKENGVEEIVLLLGYLSHKITEHFGDGSDFGIKIKYHIGDVSDDTGTRIRNSENLLNDPFLLLYCDNYWPLDIEGLVSLRKNHNSLMTMTIYSNKFGATKNNVFIDGNNVIKYDRSRTEENLNGVDIGFFVMNKKVFNFMPEYNFSFEDEIISRLITERQLTAYKTDHHYYSIGKMERIPATEKFLQLKKVIFLDRDGVINKKRGGRGNPDYVKNWEEFKFLPGVFEALRLLFQNNYQIYLITNQAGIARGFMTEKDLNDIHSRMLKEVEDSGANIEKIYYCPHGWNDGCDCRKPKPGMLLKAAFDNHIDLTKSIFIGDDERDLQAGQSARCKTFLVDENKNLLDIVKNLI